MHSACQGAIMSLPNLHDLRIPVSSKGSILIRFIDNGRPWMVLLHNGPESQQWTVGRSPAAGIVLSSVGVSSQHAVIELYNGRFTWIEGSPTNASVLVLNGNRKIAREYDRWPVVSGMAIELPSVRVTFEVTG